MGLRAENAELQKLLAAKKAVGVVVGTVSAKGREITAVGKMSKDGAAADGDTIFEIGSVTKVFTSLALADMIEKGEVKGEDSVAKYLPVEVKVPSRNGKQVTLMDLSMQVSGLARLPFNLASADRQNPYADYTVEKMYEFLGRTALLHEPGSQYLYSNLAVGLLGHALARKAGMSYEELVKTRILTPLGMTSTYVTVPEAAKARFADGYGADLEPKKHWDLPTLAGAGALRSTVNDMLKFVAANLELSDTPLKAAMRRMRAVDHETGVPGMLIAMGWHAFVRDGKKVWWHNGATGGFHSFVGFDPESKKGVVVLCNTAVEIDGVGRGLLGN